MRTYLAILVFMSLSVVMSCAQSERQDYQGEWIGFLPNKNSFNFTVTLEKLENQAYHLTIANDGVLIDEKIKSSNANGVLFNMDEQLSFDLENDPDGEGLTGFIKTGKLLYRMNIPKVGENKFEGAWNPFMLNNGLQSDDIMLYVEHTEGDNMIAYPFLGDQRFRGTWTAGFNRQGNLLSFRDTNTGFNFRATLLENTIELEILLVNALVAQTSLTHTNDGWEYSSNPVDQSPNTHTPALLNDGWVTANCSEYGIDTGELQRMIDSIHANALVNTHSVLIAKDHKLVFETYFDGFNAHIPHDLRSASKSISSAMIGIAIQDNVLKSVDENLYDFIPKDYEYTLDSLKSKIKLKDLLTMSSGFDVNNLASEDYYQNPENPNNWLTSVLEAPVIHEPGTYADYGSANPFLLGVCLNERLNKPLEVYMDEKLFAPLGITNYINQTDDTGVTPYFGGGMLLTSRDLLKFGQLYLNKGQWNGTQIIPEAWVEESFQKHVQLQDVRDKNHYGYQWWHDTYEINGKAIATIEARGAGGQFIFIIPELDSVVVITSGNFRNRKGNQPRDILNGFLLPALLN
ncbi:serine hydrolase [Aureisphaera galaxeae]|uniref:serine hydrolase domain-containing protein n=1 Tax=Aureisphaera galaxeae TaxID=1538023 RepID=UPI0023502445|nr:serine hydrolase [Aureisphaera galaxeae]MDC8003894.1 serine hydrolase [Aureisphaera galaxeae]